MAKKIVDTILPTTMVGSYPRPSWYKQQLLGRDIQVAFKEASYEETYHDAVAAVVRDQEEAGLDIVTDGNMWYDDYVGVIGSFCWYMYERIGGFEPAREPHPSGVGAPKSQGKAIQVVRTDEARPPYVAGNFPKAEVQFMCLAADDPELNRPKLQKEPDVLINVE